MSPICVARLMKVLLQAMLLFSGTRVAQSDSTNPDRASFSRRKEYPIEDIAASTTTCASADSGADLTVGRDSL